MEATAGILCRQFVGGDADYSAHMKRVHPWAWSCKCPRTVECAWEGDERGAAIFGGDMLYAQIEEKASPIGATITYGGITFRVVEQVYSLGAMCDSFYVMLAHNPHAELQIIYRRAARWLLRKVVKSEARVRGFMLQPVEGREMPCSRWIADRLF
jgi:hypothetical protein